MAKASRFLQKKYTNGQKAHEKMLNIISHSGNAKSKPQWNASSHLLGWLHNKIKIKIKIKKCVAKNVEKLAPLCIAGGSMNCAATVEKSLVAPQKVKHSINHITQKFHTWVFTQEISKQVFKQIPHSSTQMFMSSSTIHDSQKVENNTKVHQITNGQQVDIFIPWNIM